MQNTAGGLKSLEVLAWRKQKWTEVCPATQAPSGILRGRVFIPVLRSNVEWTETKRDQTCLCSDTRAEGKAACGPARGTQACARTVRPGFCPFGDSVGRAGMRPFATNEVCQALSALGYAAFPKLGLHPPWALHPPVLSFPMWKVGTVIPTPGDSRGDEMG